MFVDVGHAGHLVPEPCGAADLGDPVVGQPCPVCVPSFVEGEARQDRRSALDGIWVVRIAVPRESPEASRGWAFTRIAATLDPAARGTRDPWDELARLADQIGVRELADTAAIARRAGSQGAKILDTLTAKAASLRDQQLTAALARAKSRTETMTVPVALSVLGYLILLGYPAYARITGG
jgi:hypothetical protein